MVKQEIINNLATVKFKFNNENASEIKKERFEVIDKTIEEWIEDVESKILDFYSNNDFSDIQMMLSRCTGVTKKLFKKQLEVLGKNEKIFNSNKKLFLESEK